MFNDNQCTVMWISFQEARCSEETIHAATTLMPPFLPKVKLQCECRGAYLGKTSEEHQGNKWLVNFKESQKALQWLHA